MAVKKVLNKKTAKKVVKKTPAKPAVKKTIAKKTPAKKEAAKKVVVKKAPAKAKPAAKKAVKKIIPIPVHKPAAPVLAGPAAKKLTAKEAREFKDVLLTLRERVSGEYSTLSRDNLEANQRDPSLSDQGTDTFDREMELNMMGSEQEVIFEIDAALRRIEKGTFGICELTGQPINIERLQALPYVRYTVRAQSELEKGRAHYRPFGGTMRS
ncbi:MAG: TraR/DksA family transcriptional regulator [Kiritimatiellaceae bacterium]|nr:TraR/DksA family transcriptional regulator [Kiritimatiellaceae bacterium]